MSYRIGGLGAQVAMIDGYLGQPSLGPEALETTSAITWPGRTSGFPKPTAKAVALRLTSTLDQAYAYAYNGWYYAVKFSIDQKSKGNVDASEMWLGAARMYREAARYTGQAGATVSGALAALKSADQTADAARKAGGGVVGPVGPKPMPIVPGAPRRWPLMLAAGVGVLALGFGVWKALR